MKQTHSVRWLTISLPLLCLALLFTPLFFTVESVSAQATPVEPTPTPLPSENINVPLGTQTTAVASSSTSSPIIQQHILKIEQNSDDMGMHYEHCDTNGGPNEVYLGYCRDGETLHFKPIISGLRFDTAPLNGISLTAITDMYIVVGVERHYENYLPPIAIYGHKVSNSPTFQAGDHPEDRLDETTMASVQWPMDSSWRTIPPLAETTQFGLVKTPSLTPILQEMLDTGWNFGHPLTFILTPTGSIPPDLLEPPTGWDDPQLTQHSRRFIALERTNPTLQIQAQLVVEYLDSCIPSPNEQVTLCVTDANGNPVTNLTLNDEGWPMLNDGDVEAIANPLQVTAVFHCPASSGQACNGHPSLVVNSDNGKGRVYWDEQMIPYTPNEVSCATQDDYSFEDLLHIYCTGPLSVLPSRSKALQVQVWVQPSEATTLQISADWDTHTANADPITVAQADIYPVVFLHGILGSMPPRNSNITSWPQTWAIPLGESWLDPFTGSYNPLIENLLKMGYELDNTLYPTTYDWRQSNRISACWLADTLNRMQANATAPYVKQVNGQVEADVIVHSMGGMVLRSYLQDMGRRTINNGVWSNPCPYQDDVHKAIFIATPHRGFPITYNTRENLTWEDYLSTEVDPASDGLPFIPLATLMDNLVWPFFIHKQYAPNILEACYTSGPFSIDELLSICPEQAVHAMSHSTATQDGRYRGINSLREMLPDETVPVPYLYDSSGSYPHSRTANPLLDGSTGLNSPSSLQTLLNHVPAENIYTIYSDNVDTVTGYEVISPPSPVLGYRMCGKWVQLAPGGLPTCALYWDIPATEYWANGEPVDIDEQITVDNRGDDLIPEYSTNLDSDWETATKLIELGDDNALNSNQGGHKRVVSSPTTQNAVAAILTGFAEPSETVPDSPVNTKFAINSPYKTPIFLLSNLNTMLTFTVFSPVDVLLTNPQGQRIGYDPVTGNVVNEIPNAFYSGNGTDMEFFILPPQEGTYQVTTTGTGNGTYAYAFHHVTATDTELLAMASGEAVLGQVVNETVSFTRPVDTVFLSDTEANGPWLAENGWGVATGEGDVAPPAWGSNVSQPIVSGRPVTLTLTTPLDLTTAQQARLWFNSRADFTADSTAVVELSVDNGLTWQPIMQLQGEAEAWEKQSYELTPFTQHGTPPILLRFVFIPATSTDAWLLDDIHIEGIEAPNHFSVPFEDDFEGWSRWQVTGNWERITHTVQSGDYSWQSSSGGGQLTLAGTISLSQTVAPQLSFWQQADGVGEVELSTNDGATWTMIYSSYQQTHPVDWEEIFIPLDSFIPHEIQLRFNHISGGVWLIDNLAVTDQPLTTRHALPFVDDFEGDNQWQALGGWQTTNSPVHSGMTSWQTTSPNSALKLLGQIDLSGVPFPQMRFWHRFDLPAGSYGTVDVSADEGLTWTTVHTQTASFTDWTEVSLNLTAFAEQEIRIAFFLREVGTGQVLELPEATSNAHTLAEEGTLDTDTQMVFALWILPLMMGGIGLIYIQPKGRRKNLLGGTVILVGIFFSLNSCIAIGPSPNFDPEALDIKQGEMEIVIPAEHYISEAQVSPDGTWLYYLYTDSQGDTKVGLLDIPENVLYSQLIAPGGIWLDSDHMAYRGAQGLVWRLSDMTVMPRHVVHVESFEEGRELLAGATDLFFVQRASYEAIESTDPDFPYSIRFEPSVLGCGQDEAGLYTPCIEAMLSEEQTYQLHGARLDSAAQVEMYSPDGAYYIYKDGYSDLTGESGRGTTLFRTGETERLTYGYRYEWRAEFLGWAHDSSGAYILYRPKSALGDLTRSQYPIRKYLVPGAEARGLPTVISPAPTPRWLPTPAVTPPISTTASSAEDTRQVISLAQQNYDGWVIDDVVIENPPTVSLWIEDFPNHNSRVASGGFEEIKLPSLNWQTSGAESCWGSGGWAPRSQLISETGEWFISDQVITTYYLTCFNGVAHTTAEVMPDPGYPAPLSSFTANGQAPLFTTPNTPFTLQWHATHGSNCRSDGWTDNEARYGTQEMAGGPAGKHLFTLTCGAETLSVLVVAQE